MQSCSFCCCERTAFKSTGRTVAIICINQTSVTFWYQNDITRPRTARKRNQNWVRHGKIKKTFLPARCHAARTPLDGEWNDLEFSAKKYKLIRSYERCAKYMTTAQVAQQDLHSRKVYAKNKLPCLTAHLTKHKTKSILRPRTTSEGQKWMISKHEHPCLVLFPLEIMFTNTISSKYICF